MDTLIVIGDLTASENFSEAAFVVHNNLFRVLHMVLTCPAIAKIVPMYNPNSELSYHVDTA